MDAGKGAATPHSASAKAAEPTYFAYATPVGRLTIASDGRSVVRVDFGEVREAGKRRATALTNQAAEEVLRYLAGRSHVFTVPVDPKGTEFQRRVWRALLDIPYGQTRTYSQVAAYIGRPKAARSVGTALAKNPVPIILPCHRVVRAAGDIGAYRGGAELKRELLDLEARNS